MRTVLHAEIAKERCLKEALNAYNAAIASGDSESQAREDASDAAKEYWDGDADVAPVKVGDVFEEISLINTTTNTVSSLGTYASEMSIQISGDEIRRLKNMVPENSVAFKILDGAEENNLNLRRGYSFSDKQKWAISYELLKNKDFVKNIGKKIYKRNADAASKQHEQRAKLAKNKAGSQSHLDQIKANKKKLGDYYKWLNTRDNQYRKEYFSKKYSAASVNAFLKK